MTKHKNAIEEFKSSESMKKFWAALSEIKEFVKAEHAMTQNKTLKKIYDDLHKIYKTTTEKDDD